MKILAIRIKNLASLEGFTELNFQEEPLFSAGIYAITGPTGAGKSTILDALCLALYDNTPRYRNAESHVKIADITGNTINQNDARGILRDGTAEGSAEVDFVGIDGQHYRAQWSVRRARNRIDGNLQSSVMSLTNLTANTEIPGKKTELLTEIERLAGLNFEQFTRSVLLAQGDFTAFLKAGKDEKSSLLEKLTGTHVYSKISQKVYEMHSEQKQKLQNMSIQQQGITILTEEELSELLNEIKSFELQIGADELQLGKLSNAIHWYEQLNKFKEGLNLAKTIHEQSQNKSIEAEPRRKQLQKIFYVQSVRENVNEFDSVRGNIEKTDSEAAKVHERLSLLQTGKSDKEAEVSALGVQLKEKILWETSCKPELDKARQLDIQLDERHNQIRQLESDEKELSLSLDKMEQEVAGQEAEWLSLEDALAKSEQWFTAHEQRRRVAENKDLIIAKLTEAGELYGRVSRLINGIQSANNQVRELTKEKEDDEKKFAKINSIRTEKQKELDNSASTLGNVDINRLQNEKSKKDAVLNDLVEAKANWERIYQEGFSLKSLRKELTLNDEKREATEAELEKALHDFQTKETEKEAAFGILENARLAVTESLEKVRARLRENEACPVCGSIHHPYVSEHPVYKEVLTSVERDYKQSEESYGKELARKTRLEQMLDNLKELRLRTRTEIDDKEKVIQDLRAKWEKSRVYVKMIDVIEEERTEWLGLELNRVRDEQVQLHEELRNYNEKRERVDKYRNELTDIDKELNSLQNRIKDIERERKTLEIQKDNDISEHKGTEEKLQTLRSMLAEYFSSDDWFKNWRENPVSFAEQIEKFADDWKGKVEQRDRNKSTRDIIEERVKGLNKQVDVLRRSLTDHQDKLKRVSEDHEKLREQRKLIFDGRPIVDVETEIKSAVENSRNALDNTRKEMTAFAQQISAEEGRYEQLQKNRQGFTIRLESVEKTIDEWLSEYNTRYQSDQTLDDIRGLLAFQRDWMEEERTDLERIDTELANAKSVLLERSRDLENHERQKNSDLSFEELAKQKEELQALINERSRRKIEAEIKIKNNEENSLRLEHILRDIKKQTAVVEDWAKLNELIGSADGKKFRQIAQEYTLDVLVSFANVHLDFLSKRYVLERVPDSLGLQVVDRDMGDEVRTVNSLSGGESFLVSLALALGLASLSSDTMRVESLFIDEGFGSLDPVTLNMAMDALERLHNQGRKVGVISHVQEMTERIPVQIRVLSERSGKSRVEVVTQ